jgi:hypothetical protein
MQKRRKICIATSVGGHLHEVMQLRPVYEQHPHFYVVNDRLILPGPMSGRTYFVAHSERDVLCLWNVVEALRIFWRERPTHIISTGAGLAVPLAMAGRLFGARIMFIETFAAIRRPTLTGRLMYHLADRFVYQWDALRRFYPSAVYGGTIFDFCDARECNAAI